MQQLSWMYVSFRAPVNTMQRRRLVSTVICVGRAGNTEQDESRASAEVDKETEERINQFTGVCYEYEQRAFKTRNANCCQRY